MTGRAEPERSPDATTTPLADAARVRALDEKIASLVEVAKRFEEDSDRLEFMLKLAQAYLDKADYFSDLAAESPDATRDNYTQIARASGLRSARILAIVIDDPRHRDYEDRDEMLFVHAQALHVLGNERLARATLHRLIDQFPDSPLVPEARQYFADHYPDAPAPGELAPAPERQRSLPRKLSSTEIKRGIASIRADADRCFGRSDAEALDKVAVRIAVEGASGRILMAEALEDAKDTALGACLEAVVAKIEYPAFLSERQGFIYQFRRPG